MNIRVCGGFPPLPLKNVLHISIGILFSTTNKKNLLFSTTSSFFSTLSKCLEKRRGERGEVQQIQGFKGGAMEGRQRGKGGKA